MSIPPRHSANSCSKLAFALAARLDSYRSVHSAHTSNGSNAKVGVPVAQGVAGNMSMSLIASRTSAGVEAVTGMPALVRAGFSLETVALLNATAVLGESDGK